MSEAAAETNKPFDENMRGVLYKNEQRTTDKHPNARGRAMVDGVWYWVSSWTRASRTTGAKYQSFQFTKMTDEDIAKYVTSRAPQPEPNTQAAQQATQQSQSQNQAQSQNTQVNQSNQSSGSNEYPPIDFDDEIPF